MTLSSSASVLSDQSIYSQMDHSHLHTGPEYTINNMVDYGMDHYLTEGTSTNSSPSPVMFNTSTQLRASSPLPLQMYDQYIPQPEVVTFDAFPEHPPGYQFYDMAQPVPIVEFTDLTAPYPQEDRRRRRSQIRDKQELSSMHMVCFPIWNIESSRLTLKASPCSEPGLAKSIPRTKGETRPESPSPAG